MTGRRIVLLVTGVASALLIGGTALSAIGWLGRTTESTGFAFDAGDIRTVEIRTSAGGVRITGDDAERIAGERRATFSLHRPTITEEVVGDVLVLRATCRALAPGPCEVGYRLSVPRRMAVRVTSGAGTIEVREIDGSVSARTDVGRVRLAGLGGSVTASSDAGTVTGTDLRSPDLMARSAAGGVDLTFVDAPDTVVASSDAGSVTVVVPDDPTAYRVEVASEAGRERIAVRTDPASDRRIDATTGAGHVTVRYPTGP